MTFYEKVNYINQCLDITKNDFIKAKGLIIRASIKCEISQKEEVELTELLMKFEKEEIK